MLKKYPKIQEEEGQSLIEFIMLIPIVLAFVWYLVHVSVAINKSIVGQKHARSQLLHKMWNHRSGPVDKDFASSDRSMFYVGVSGEIAAGDSVKAVAPVEMLGLGPNPKKMADANDDPGEPPPNVYRQKVRVRSAFGICTHRKLNKDGSGTLTDFCGAETTGKTN